MVTCNGCRQQVNTNEGSHFGCLFICELCIVRLKLVCGKLVVFNHYKFTWAEAADEIIKGEGDPREDEKSP